MWEKKKHRELKETSFLYGVVELDCYRTETVSITARTALETGENQESPF